MSRPHPPRNPRLLLPDIEIPLTPTYRGRKWSWRGFQIDGGVWRDRRWGWWPVYRPHYWDLDVPEEHVERVREHQTWQISAAMDVRGNSRVALHIPKPERV